jgi:ATP-dependent helicase/nuclease subunit B
MIFLGWNKPLLHSAAEWLLDASHVEQTPDLSDVLVVVRGARAGRRLLELLALKCAERKAILRPPQIVTPQHLVTRLTQSLPSELAAASPLASALAWAEAIRDLPTAERDALFRRPGDEAGLRALLGLGRHLSQIWSELGGAGFDFRDVVRALNERFPNIASYEVPRWEVMAALHRRAGDILQDHGLIDHTSHLLHRARRGEIIAGTRVVLVGVAEMPRIVREFIGRLPEPPTALVFAPESEAAGFEEPGIIRPDYWNSRPVPLRQGQVHLVERDRDQALRAAQIVASWRDSGVPSTQMTLAVPDPEALPRLREALDARGTRTRWAQGRAASDAPSIQLLLLVADYLDHDASEPPRYEAVAALVRHPDVPRIDPADWTALDKFVSRHLPAHFDPNSVVDASSQVWKIDDVLKRWVDIAPGEISPVEAAEWTLGFLSRIYGEKEENSLSPTGRVAVHGLVLLRDILAETLENRIPWPALVRPADFLHVVLGFLSDEKVPEPPAPDVVEIVGWLELLEDDAPAVAVTSLYEGAVPESISADPFLPGSLRQALGLGDNATRMARDAFSLAAILASRPEGQGVVALIAPRFDAKENPVRPSRLLLNGLHGEDLARRVWHLAGRRGPDPQPALRNGPGFGEVMPGDHSLPQQIPVTAFRDYLESPRKFFFRHVRRLVARNDDDRELEGGSIGTLMHEVLAAFGADENLRDSVDESVIDAFITARFDEKVRDQFGRWVQPSVELQVGEIRRRLSGFAREQARLRRAGWTIRAVERSAAFDLMAAEEAGVLSVSGKIDRIDYHPADQKWRIIDYKSSSAQKTPARTHRGKDGWIDLQLPLYLQLAAPYARTEWGVELTPQICELVYFQLPDEEKKLGISEPFPPDWIVEAGEMAATVAAQILRREFMENPPLDPRWNEPSLLALCGQAGIVASEPEEMAGIGVED